MPFTDSVFTGVSGSTTAAPGQLVQSAVWNNINEDYAEALTMVMSQLITTSSFRNVLWMNGDFEVWQRGAGASASITVPASSTTGVYTADRWYLLTNANQASTVEAAAGFLSNTSASVQRDAGQTGVGVMRFAYPLETNELARLRGYKVSLSAIVITAANWSPANGTLNIVFYTGTGTEGKRGAVAFTGETSVLSIATNIPADDGAIITGTSLVAVPDNATQGEIQFNWTPVGTAGTVDAFAVDRVQLEIDSTSIISGTIDFTPTLFDDIPFSVMLQGCKRHFQKTMPYNVAPIVGSNVGESALGANAIATQRLFVNWEYPIEIRVTGTVTTLIPYTGTSGNWYDFVSSVSVAATTTFAGTKGVYITSTTSGSVTNQACIIHAQVDAGL